MSGTWLGDAVNLCVVVLMKYLLILFVPAVVLMRCLPFLLVFTAPGVFLKIPYLLEIPWADEWREMISRHSPCPATGPAHPQTVSKAGGRRCLLHLPLQPEIHPSGPGRGSAHLSVPQLRCLVFFLLLPLFVGNLTGR